MKLLLIPVLMLAMDLTPPLTTPLAFTDEDLDGYGYEQDSSGSGSGNWSEQGSADPPVRFTKISATEIRKNKDDPNTINEDTIIAAKGTGGTRNQMHDDSDLSFDVTPWLVDDVGSAVGDAAKSKSLLENKEVLASIIAGGVTGLVMAVALAAFLIYTLKKKDVAGYNLAQQDASN